MSLFAAELAVLRGRAIANLFEHLPETIEYVGLDVDGTDITEAEYTDERGNQIYEYPDALAFDGINAVFGVRHEALDDYAVAPGALPDTVHRTLHALPQYKHGRTIVLQRSPRT